MRFAEFRLFLHSMSGLRVWNAFLVLASYYFSRILRKPIQWGLPIGLSVEPTTACNLRCSECPSGLRSFTRPTGSLRLEEFKKWLDPLKDRLWALTFYFQGEPFIHPQLDQAIRYARQSGIYTMSSTNAHFLSREQSDKIVRSGLDRLIISIDGVTQESYARYRKEGRLDQVLDGVQNLIDAKKRHQSRRPYLIFQFIVFRHNEHEIGAIHELGKHFGVDEVRLKTAQVMDFDKGSDLIPENQLYARYRKKEAGNFELKNPLLNHCWKLWHAPVITWDGKVVPCCFDKDAEQVMGGLENHTFKQIWYGSDYQEFRQKLLQSRKAISICRNCTEGTKVWG